MPSSSARLLAMRSSPKPWFVCLRNARASSRRTRTSASPVAHLSPSFKKKTKIKRIMSLSLTKPRTRASDASQDGSSHDAAPGASPGRSSRPASKGKGKDIPRAQTPLDTTQVDIIDDISLADSFIMGVLRGWRLIQAASLTSEEKRDILSTTQNFMDYNSISRALQMLWDDQLLGHRQPHAVQHHLHVQEQEPGPRPDPWHDHYASVQWWDQDWHQRSAAEDQTASELKDTSPASPHLDPEEESKLKEAHQAEQLAEQMAQEASRTWAEAKRATAAIHRDRGFGKGNSGKCFKCGGAHFIRQCPDLRHAPHLKGSFGKKGNSQFMVNPYYDDFYQHKGSKKGKSKGKNTFTMDYDYDAMYFKGKSKSTGSGKGYGSTPTRSFVNSYTAEFCGLDMDLHGGEWMPATMPSSGDFEGVVDCGATASAGPEEAVKGLIQSIVAQDHCTVVEIDQSACPYFRYGNGRWGQALYQVTLRSDVSGTSKQFKVYALPNPPELHQPGFDGSMLVPILVGMDHLGPHAGPCCARGHACHAILKQGHTGLV